MDQMREHDGNPLSVEDPEHPFKVALMSNILGVQLSKHPQKMTKFVEYVIRNTSHILKTEVDDLYNAEFHWKDY